MRKYITTLIALLGLTSAQSETYYATDFELDTVGSSPSGTELEVSPSSPLTDAGVKVIDGSSTPSNPFSGKGLYLYDDDTGDNFRYTCDFNDGSNVRAVQVDFDFAAASLTANSEYVSFTVGEAGAGLSGSSSRAFEIRINGDGDFNIYSDAATASTNVGSYNTTGSNHMTVFVNSNDSYKITYILSGGDTGTVSPNSVLFIVNDVSLGEFPLVPDPSHADVAYNEGLPDMGQFSFFQGTNGKGALIIDDLVVRTIDPAPQEIATFDFRTDTVESSPGGIGVVNDPATPLGNIGIKVTDGSSSPSNPFDGNGLYLYDDNTGDSLIYSSDFLDEENTEAVQVDFEFKLHSAGSSGDRINFTVGMADKALNGSTRQAFKIEINQAGNIDVHSDDATDNAAANLVSGNNHMTVMVNSQDSSTISYDTAKFGDRSIPANHIHIFLNDTYVGEYGMVPDPSDASVAYNEGVPDIGRFSFFQDSSRKGWLLVDNIVVSEIGYDVDSAPSPTIHTVSTVAEFNSACDEADPGDIIELEDGTYTNFDINFDPNGTAGSPITFQPQNHDGVTFEESSRIDIIGDHLVVKGFTFSGDYTGSNGDIIRFTSSSNDSRLTDVLINGYVPDSGTTPSNLDWVQIDGLRNQVDNCEFINHNWKGRTVYASHSGAQTFHNILNNRFKDRPLGAGSSPNGYETVRIGVSVNSMSDASVTVENNVFENCDGEIEVISSKAGDNRIRYNTFIGCAGALTLRHGNGCLVDGNVFLGDGDSKSGAIRVNGSDHLIINNYIDGTQGRGGAAIALAAGPDPAVAALTDHWTADNVVIAYNTIRNVKNEHFDIGQGYGAGDTGSGETRDDAPTGIVIANNILDSGSDTDSDFIEGHNPADQTWKGNFADTGRALGISAEDDEIDATNSDLDLVEDTATGIYSPSSTSPVIDAADTDVEVDMDFLGGTRGSDPDVGAEETNS